MRGADYSRWEIITLTQLRKRLKAVRDQFNELPSDREVTYKEYIDPVTREIIIRIIPPIGVTLID